MQLHFEPVTEENRKIIEELALYPHQAGYIETVGECLAEADEEKRWRAVGIYDGAVLVGFAMYGFFSQSSSDGQVWLDRLLIGREHQGKGYGRAAVDMLVGKLAAEYGQRRVYLSVYDSNKPAIHLYETAGFYFNGEYDTKGERVMVCDVKY